MQFDGRSSTENARCVIWYGLTRSCVQVIAASWEKKKKEGETKFLTDAKEELDQSVGSCNAMLMRID